MGLVLKEEMVDKGAVQRELDKIKTYKEAMALNMQPFLRHLVRGRTGHFIVSEIEREGLSPVQQRYGLSDHPSRSQDGIDISNLEGLAKSIYIPRMFWNFRDFPYFHTMIAMAYLVLKNPLATASPLK